MKQIRNFLYFGLVILIVFFILLKGDVSSELIQIDNFSIAIIRDDNENVLVSVDNPDRGDFHPKLTRSSKGVLVMIYEKQKDNLSKVIPVYWTDDTGKSWNKQFEFDSLNWSYPTQGSGILQSPYITYCPITNEFFLNAIDPVAEPINYIFIWIPGDIAVTETFKVWLPQILMKTNVIETANTYVGKWLVSTAVDSIYTENGLSLCTVWNNGGNVLSPRYVNPNWAHGTYYDGESHLVAHPASNLEMATGANRIYLVAQIDLEAHKSKILFKATVTDLDPDSDTFLFTKDGPEGMDKYLDIEVWPWQMYLADGIDPDVSSSGSNVCVVYTQDGDVKCSYSFDDGDHFSVSNVASGAGFPAVHMSGDTVYCAYVKNGNLFTVTSEDGGTTWVSPVRVNDIDGTVVGEYGTVDIIDAGIVWTDTRNGAKDVYFASGAEIPIIDVKSISTGFGISAVIENTGTVDADYVSCTITIDAPIMILGDLTTTKIDIPAESEITIDSGFIFGFGPASITVNAEGSTKDIKGIIIGPFVLSISD